MSLQVTLDGIDVSDIAQEATSQHWLNRKWVATVKIPVAQAFLPSEGARMKLVDPDLAGLGLNPIDHHGTIKFVSAKDGGDNDGMAEYTSESAREIWEWRRARNGPATGDAGNYIKPTFFEVLEKGPLVLQDVLTQSADGSDPADGEGDMAIDLATSTFSTGGISLSGTPMATPMSIDQLVNLMCSTGEVDVIEHMIDSGGNMASLEVVDGNYGSDLSSAVNYVFEPDGTASAIEMTYDVAKLANKIRYLLGPRVSETRWRRSIEASNGDIPDNSRFTQADLVAAIMASRSTWLVRDDVRVYDTFDTEADAVPLYWRLWQDESMWRLQPRKLWTLTPREGELPLFDIGDLVGVGAWANFMGGFDGVQRAFGRKLTWDVDGVVTVSEIQTSADSEVLA